jgi:phospholipid/cholesterol/gamma-HCH transport system substrate-binding protein
VIKNEDPRDFTEMLDSLSRVSTKVERVMTNLEATSKELANNDFHEDVRGVTHSLNNILKTVDEGDGYAKRLLADPKEADRLSRVVQNLEHTSTELGHAARSVSAILGRVQTGPGLAHDLVYKDDASRTLAQFGGAADEVSTTLKGIREGNGLARSMLYGDEGSAQLMGNLNQVSQDMSQIVADLRAGKGTLGALLVDPSVYEDVKLLLGNVERNKALRALVRYSIKQDEQAPRVEVKDSKGRAARSEGPSAEE